MPLRKTRQSPPRAESFAVAIMAAGKGTRLRSSRAKVLHKVGGKQLLEHVISAARTVVSPQDIFVILGHQASQVQEAMATAGVNFVLQEPQRGTGHALMCAREVLRPYSHVLVLSGDVPLIRPQTIAHLKDFHLQQRASMTILTAIPIDPAAYGRIVRKTKDRPEVQAIVEHKNLGKHQAGIREINSGIYAFRCADLFERIDRLTTKNPHSEYYLTDMASILVRAKKKVVAIQAENAEEVLGANTLSELMSLDAHLRRLKVEELLAKGVSIYRPETCTIDLGVTVEPDTVIEPFVQIYGNTRIGSNCLIRSFSVIQDSYIADNVTIRPGSILDSAEIGSGAVIGPYSHLRPGSQIAEGAHVGNFVETKKTRLGKGSKANHLTYLGDAEIGANVNVGAGTITCNYDGENKHQTVIEDGAFIGSDSTLVAPVRIGSGAYVGAASCITEDVPSESLAISRSPQVNKADWVKKRRRAKTAK